MASLEFDSVNKTYDTKGWAVRDLSLGVEDGEFMVLVGPSGCGKTTALRMLAGFEPITAGEIRIGGRPVNDVPPRDRDIAMVFQNYALYPHMNVYDNIGYGLKVRHVAKAERDRRIRHAAGILALTDELKRKPSQLSGGQRQRVAMGRAIVREPQAFLMDEPLSNLDARLRVRMRTEIAKLQRDLGVTTVYVTHDQVEAMTMADRVAVMRGGVLQQVDTPQRLYSDPKNLFVATFIGSPSMNLLQGRLESVDGHVGCQIGAYTVAIPDRLLSEQPALARAVGETVAVGVRPDAVSVGSQGEQEGLLGTVAVAEELGSEVIAHVTVEATPVEREDVVDELVEVDSAELLSGTEPSTAVVTAVPRTTVVARLPGESGIGRGQRVSLAFEADKLYFFSLEDGGALLTRRAGAAELVSTA